MIAVGRQMLATIGPPIDVSAMIDALDRAAPLVQAAANDLDLDFRDRMLEIDKAMKTLRRAKWPRKDGSAEALDDAIQAAHFHRQGRPADSRWFAVYYGGGVRTVWVEPRECGSFEVDIGVLTRRFGASLVSAIFRLAAGANRVTSLIHLLKLNDDALERDTIAHERNFQFAATQLVGYLRELGKVVDDLRNAQVEQALADPSPWHELLRQRARWDDRVRHLRNAVTFHLGRRSKAQPEVERLAARGSRSVVYEVDGGMRSDMRFTGGESLLLASSGLTLKDFRAVVDYSADAWDVIYDALEGILRDLLVQCGAWWPHPARPSRDDEGDRKPPPRERVLSPLRPLVIVDGGWMRRKRMPVDADDATALAHSGIADPKSETEVYRVALVPLNDAAKRRVASEGSGRGVLYP